MYPKKEKPPTRADDKHGLFECIVLARLDNLRLYSIKSYIKERNNILVYGIGVYHRSL
jgi:hypothetical protein